MKKIQSLIVSLALACGVAGAGIAMAGDPPKDAPKHDMHDMMKPRDCAKAPADMKERCEARNKVLEICKDKKEDEHKKCMMENRPKKADK